eukprot:UN06297
MRPFIINTGGYYKASQNVTENDVKMAFLSTIDNPNISIHNIIMLNDEFFKYKNHLYELKLKQRCEVMSQPRENIEKYLFHGSSYEKIRIIMQNGFDRWYGKNQFYGPGNYFARDARMSDYFASETNGKKYMLYCKVLIGRTTMINKNNDK